MAASGINEHKEGCRKQRVLERAALARKMMMERQMNAEDPVRQPEVQEDPDAPGYIRKMGSPSGIKTDPYTMSPHQHNGDATGGHSPTAIDKLRRDGVRAQQLVAYSAKLPNRLSSVNYTQQW